MKTTDENNELPSKEFLIDQIKSFNEDWIKIYEIAMKFKEENRKLKEQLQQANEHIKLLMNR